MLMNAKENSINAIMCVKITSETIHAPVFQAMNFKTNFNVKVRAIVRIRIFLQVSMPRLYLNQVVVVIYF